MIKYIFSTRKFKRKTIKNVRAYRIGSREVYPLWLKNAINRGEVIIEENYDGVTDVGVTFCGQSPRYNYENDWLVKLPEGPIVGMSEKTFYQLYQPQKTKEFIIEEELCRCVNN